MSFRLTISRSEVSTVFFLKMKQFFDLSSQEKLICGRHIFCIYTSKAENYNISGAN